MRVKEAHRWEYTTHSSSYPLFAERLEEFGNAGWELCGIMEVYPRTYIYTFKRSGEASRDWYTQGKSLERSYG